VVKLVSGTAPSLDANGDDVPDSPAELAALGVTAEELAAISGQAPSGSYFRVTMRHFSGFDFNWAFGAPADSEFPPSAPGSTIPDLPCITDNGSYFECERLTLGEDIPLVGTGIGLHYNSDRVTGYHGNTTFTVPVTEAKVPPSAKRAEVEVTVLGVTETKTYAIAPNITHTFTWNGLDAYGREWPGETVAEVRVALIYDGVYVDTKSFGSYGNGEAITGNGARKEVLLNRRYEFRLGAFHGTGLGLGGWSLSAHHVYDPASRTLYRGDGGRRNSDGIGANVRIFGGVPGGAGGADPDGTPRLQAHFGQINGLVTDDAGALYAAQTSGGEDIRKIDNGVVTTFAGAGPSGHNGDGGPATLAQIDYPSGLVALRDGRICFSEFYQDSIRCVGTDGIVRPLAGGGGKDLGAVPLPALEAKVTRPGELAEGPDGSIFVTLSAVGKIARIDRAGTIEIAAGGGLDAGENVPALKVDLQTPRGIAVAADGSVYVAEAARNRIRRIDPSGRVTTFAGSGDAGNTGDGGFATSATFKRPTALALDGTGALYVSDQGNSRIRRVDGGKVQAFAGGGDRRNGPGAAARLASVTATAMVVARDGTLYAANDDDHTVLVFSAAFPGTATTDIVMSSEDGAELYVFDGRGRHLRTLDGLTTDLLTSFTYDAAGRLTRIEDRHGNALDIVRDAASGRATRITSPFGHATDLGYDADGWLATVTDPIGRKESFAYAAGGLLTQRIDAGGGLHAMAYDALGRLTRDATAENASFDLVGSGTATTVTSGLGRREVHTFTGGLDRDEVRSYQAPDGTVTPWTLRRDGTANVALPDGTVIDVTREADPRLGMLVPYAAKHLVSFPSGLSRSITQVWSAQLDASGGLVELKGDRSSPDGRSTTVYDGAMRAITSTSPEGRVVKVTLDGEGRLAPSACTNAVVRRAPSRARSTRGACRSHLRTTIAAGWRPSTKAAGRRARPTTRNRARSRRSAMRSARPRPSSATALSAPPRSCMPMARGACSRGARWTISSASRRPARGST
jgi:YD repeat-containing protein